MLAMVGCGEYGSVREAAQAIVRVRDRVLPDASIADAYEKRYRVFRSLYPALRENFRAICEQ